MKADAPGQVDDNQLDGVMTEFFRHSVELRKDVTGIPKEFRVQTEVQQFETTERDEEQDADAETQNRGNLGAVQGIPPQILAPPKPTITGLDPASGTIAGGTHVNITGTNFLTSSQVSFDGAVIARTWVNSQSLLIVTPMHAVGPVSVDVCNIPGDPHFCASTFYTYTTP